MTEQQTLSEKNDEGDSSVNPAQMLYSKSYRDRIMTMWSNGKVSISNMMYNNEQEAMKQIDFFYRIREKFIDTRK